MGGLGNQLHGFAAGWAIAGSNDCDLIINAIRVPFGSNVQRRYELSSFPLDFGSKKISIVNDKPRTFHNVREPILRKLRFSSRKELKALSVDYWDSKESVKSQLDSIEVGNKVCGAFLDFEWVEVAKSFGFPTRIQLFTESGLLRELIKEIDDSDIAIHVRLGDYLLHNDVFSSIPEEYYLEALKRCDYKNAKTITLFSDSPKLVASHYPKLFQFLNRIESSKWSSIETMKIMSSYKRIISANSTFSTWAGWFAQQRGAEIFTPVPHLRNDWIDKMPNNWYRYSLKDNLFI
jgi:hypothetical protein